MFGKPEWFTRRKYLGWGIQPKTWQGWVYIAVILIPIIGMQFIPQIDNNSRNAILIVWAVLLAIDIVDIMAHLKIDEREKMHEAIAERNALWAIVIVLAMGLSYRIAQSIMLTGKPQIDPVILSALFVGLGAKAATNIYLDRKD